MDINQTEPQCFLAQHYFARLDTVFFYTMLAVVEKAPIVRELLTDDGLEALAGADGGTRGGAEQTAREDHAQFDELVGGYVDGVQHAVGPSACDDAVDPGRMAVDAVGGPEGGGPRQRRFGSEVAEADPPLVAPDLEVDVDDV